MLLHWKEPAVQVGLGQEASSLLSEQSASSSQTNEEEIHWPSAQRNSSAVQFFRAEGTCEVRVKRFKV